MTKREIMQHGCAPAADVRLDLVDAVPPHVLLKRKDVLEARPAIRAALRLDARPGQMTSAPAAAHLLVPGAARHAQARITCEPGEELLEVLRLEADVRVDDDEDVRLETKLGYAYLDGRRDLTAACSRRSRQPAQADPRL
jgi:hypothetical protein